MGSVGETSNFCSQGHEFETLVGGKVYLKMNLKKKKKKDWVPG